MSNHAHATRNSPSQPQPKAPRVPRPEPEKRTPDVPVEDPRDPFPVEAPTRTPDELQAPPPREAPGRPDPRRRDESRGRGRERGVVATLFVALIGLTSCGLEQTAERVPALSLHTVTTDEAALVDRLASCVTRCDEQRDSATNRATCRLQCVDAQRPEIGECRETCADEMVECWTPCEDIELEDDAATCRLRCQNLARDCIEECGPIPPPASS